MLRHLCKTITMLVAGRCARRGLLSKPHESLEVKEAVRKISSRARSHVTGSGPFVEFASLEPGSSRLSAPEITLPQGTEFHFRHSHITPLTTGSLPLPIYAQFSPELGWHYTLRPTSQTSVWLADSNSQQKELMPVIVDSQKPWHVIQPESIRAWSSECKITLESEERFPEVKITGNGFMLFSQESLLQKLELSAEDLMHIPRNALVASSAPISSLSERTLRSVKTTPLSAHIHKAKNTFNHLLNWKSSNLGEVINNLTYFSLTIPSLSWRGRNAISSPHFIRLQGPGEVLINVGHSM